MVVSMVGITPLEVVEILVAISTMGVAVGASLLIKTKTLTFILYFRTEGSRKTGAITITLPSPSNPINSSNPHHHINSSNTISNIL